MHASVEPNYSAVRKQMGSWLDMQLHVWASVPKMAELQAVGGAGEGQGAAMSMHHTCM